MNIRYFLIAFSLLLAACDSGTEVQVTAPGQSGPVTDARIVSTDESSGYSAAAIEPAGNLTELAETVPVVERPVESVASAPGQSESLLPLGRLIGIVDTGDYRQATINNQGKVLRLREGDDWQGWKVEAIGLKKIVISQDNAQHSLLLLSEFRAPASAPGLSDNDAAARVLAAEKTGSAVVQQLFTEDQLVELRARLVMGRFPGQ